MASAPGDPQYEEDTLYQHMPVYHARLSAVQALLSKSGNVDLDSFHMHYHGTVPLENAQAFFADSGAVLDLGCGYGSSVIWLAERSSGYQSLLGVDLMPEHIEIAEQLARRRLGEDHRAHFLAMDISAMTPPLLDRHAGVRSVTCVLALNTFLHLTGSQRTATWQFLDQVLVKDARVYVEDFFARRTLTREEHDTMARESGCAYLPAQAEYADLVSRALPGARIEIEDISHSYTAFARGRHVGYQGDDPDKRRFYRVVFEMLDCGAVGGIRLKIVR